MKIAILCAAGIGDALLMQISAAELQKQGYETVTFSKHLPALASWFPGFQLEVPTGHYDAYDAILLQHDNTAEAKRIRALNKPVFTLYGDHQVHKHGPLRPDMDVVLDPRLCMADNIAICFDDRGRQDCVRNMINKIKKIVPILPHKPSSSYGIQKFNGLCPLPHLIFRKHTKRIILHPTSTSEKKNWRKESFLQLKELLAKEGWEPVFIVAPEEAAMWESPILPTLSDLAAYLYESAFLIGNDSGPGHLASNLGLKTLIIGPCAEHLMFWRPGWAPGEIAYPPAWVQKFKLTRRRWQNFVSLNKVFKIFSKLKYEL